MGGKVLVADDSGVMRKIITRSLNSCGLRDVVEAVDGVDALIKFNEEKFDLVLIDWNMPNKSGLQFVQEIRAAGSDVPVIMVTTEAESERVRDAVMAGISDYLAKPFDNDVLRQKIDKFVCV